MVIAKLNHKIYLGFFCFLIIFQAERKHRRFQELDRFMHYYTRFKNHELSYQVWVKPFLLTFVSILVIQNNYLIVFSLFSFSS